jgi:hypothetical protein
MHVDTITLTFVPEYSGNKHPESLAIYFQTTYIVINQILREKTHAYIHPSILANNRSCPAMLKKMHVCQTFFLKPVHELPDEIQCIRQQTWKHCVLYGYITVYHSILSIQS